jgi:UDP-glucuronate 4-epimerase
MDSNPTILITGAAGFIGFHLSKKLCNSGYKVLGIDNLNQYYDVRIKQARLEILKRLPGFTFRECDLVDYKGLDSLFQGRTLKYVVNLAAQAGVRYSLTNPHAYLESNLHGFLNILEVCRHHHVEHLVYASSSSVYGAITMLITLFPFMRHLKRATSSWRIPIQLYSNCPRPV